MATGSESAATSRTSRHPGWLLIAPGGRPYAWYNYDPALSFDDVSAMQRFEPEATAVDALVERGWVVREGSGVELVYHPKHLCRATA
jgi:hypothetical protein